MKNFIKIIVYILLINSPIMIFAQSNSNQDIYEQVFELAQNLDKSGAKKEAFLEYKRYLFLQDYSEGIHQEEAYLALANIFLQDKNYSQSLVNMEMALNINNSDKNKILYLNLIREIGKKINANFENNKFILNYKFSDSESLEIKELAWITSLENQIIIENFDSFKQDFDSFCNLFPNHFSKDQIESINQGLTKINNFKPKNPKIAKFLSIIPGLGQLYAGYPLDALNAFLLDGSLFAISAYSLGTLNFCDFALFEFIPTFRFYRGNFYNAEKETFENNTKKINSLKTCILDILG